MTRAQISQISSAEGRGEGVTQPPVEDAEAATPKIPNIDLENGTHGGNQIYMGSQDTHSSITTVTPEQGASNGFDVVDDVGRRTLVPWDLLGQCLLAFSYEPPIAPSKQEGRDNVVIPKEFWDGDFHVVNQDGALTEIPNEILRTVLLDDEIALTLSQIEFFDA